MKPDTATSITDVVLGSISMDYASIAKVLLPKLHAYLPGHPLSSAGFPARYIGQ